MAFLDMRDYSPAAKIYWHAAVLCGLPLVGWSVAGVISRDLPEGAQVLGLAVCAGLVGLFPVSIRGTKTSFVFGEIFIFLALFLFDVQAGIVAAAMEAAVGSWVSSKKWTSRILSPALNSISMLAAGSLVQWANPLVKGDSGSPAMAIVAYIGCGAAYFCCASMLTSTLFALKKGLPITPIKWWVASGWLASAFMANAAIAALLFLSFERVGVSVLLVSVPVIVMFLYSLHAHAQRREADDRADGLLRNMLPHSIAEELKATGFVKPRRHEEVTVLFSDFRGFTNIASTIPPQTLVSELNDIFSAFDAIVQRHGVEKIKTVGDAYMAASGLPEPCADHAQRCARAALEMNSWLDARNSKNPLKWPIRIGIHSGPVVAGLVGTTRYAYDLWGDTVNIAARLEATSTPGCINVSAYTVSLLGNTFAAEYRGKLEAKGKGEIDMYFLKAAGHLNQLPSPSSVLQQA